jgi:hypothetical protein
MRRAGLSVLLGVLLVLLTASAAGAGQPPNVTGAWAPAGGGPAWQLTASGEGLTHLHAEWHGPPGHPNLFGTFDGTLTAAGNVYSGSHHVSEGPNIQVSGTMTFTIVGLDRITVDFAQENGVAGKIILSGHATPAPAAPAGPQTVTAANFGTGVIVAAPPGAPISAISPPIPTATRAVDVDAEFTDADIEKIAAELKLVLAAYNDRRQKESIGIMCVFFAGHADVDRSTSCTHYLAKLAGVRLAKLRLPSAVGAGCSVAMAPLWSRGPRPTARQIARAVALTHRLTQISCVRTGTKLSLHIAARGTAQLGKLLGPRAQAGFIRTSGGNDGADPRLHVNWRRR